MKNEFWCELDLLKYLPSGVPCLGWPLQQSDFLNPLPVEAIKKASTCGLNC